jgi:hypothetical protein
MKKKIYLSGPITNSPSYWEEFDNAEYALKGLDYIVLNPTIFPLGLSQANYMRLSMAMIDCCDTVCMLPGWEKSDGAHAEYLYAKKCGKEIIYSYKRIPKKCCKTCRYSSLKNIAYVKDGGNLQYTQKRYCFAEKEPSEVKDDWGANCDKWKPIKKEVSNQ